MTPKEKFSASAIAGGVAGATGGMLRSRGNIIPGAIMFSIFGAAGQAIYNRADANHVENPEKKNLKDSWINSKWSPMKVLSDAEYEGMMQEKLLRVNADIALIDESIAALRIQEEACKKEQAAKAQREQDKSVPKSV